MNCTNLCVTLAGFSVSARGWRTPTRQVSLCLVSCTESLGKCLLSPTIQTVSSLGNGNRSLLVPWFDSCNNVAVPWCYTYGSHLTISLIFVLFVWIKYLIFKFQKDSFYAIYVLYHFTNLILRERFNTASGFHFETKSPNSGSWFSLADTIKWS